MNERQEITLLLHDGEQKKAQIQEWHEQQLSNHGNYYICTKTRTEKQYVQIASNYVFGNADLFVTRLKLTTETWNILSYDINVSRPTYIQTIKIGLEWVH